MTVINTNTSATVAANALSQNDRALNTAIERLATGKRINNAGDDAAGLAISSRMTSKIEGLQQAARNANDAISLLQTADGAMQEISSILQRMREISVQAASGAYSSIDITSIKVEFDALMDEVQAIVLNTSWNGKVLLANSAGGFLNPNLSFQIGDGASQSLTLGMGNFKQDFSSGFELNSVMSNDITLSTGAAVYRAYTIAGTGALEVSDGTTTVSVGSATYASVAAQVTAIQNATDYDNLLFTVSEDPSNSALLFTYKSAGYVGTQPTYSAITSTRLTNPVASPGNAISHLDTAITNVNSKRSEFGASINRLEYVINNLNVNVSNLKQSRSRVLDADYASETTELAKNQIIKQAGTAMLAQANQKSQSVLSLLKS